jgi:hypothetical protein
MVQDTENSEQVEETVTKSAEAEEVEKTENQRVDTEKAFQDTVKSSLETLTEVIQSVAETQKGVSDSIDTFDERLKALETPSDLPLAPRGTAGGDDVGAKVTVPRDPYPQGTQAGLDDDRSGRDKPVSDKGGLKMQKKSDDTEIVEKSEHSFTTETPRPNASPETVEKSYQTDFSPILKDAREAGHEGLSKVAQNILSGKYYKPSDDEVRGF